MDLTVQEAIDESRKALEVALAVGDWADAARFAERLAIYCELAVGEPVPS